MKKLLILLLSVVGLYLIYEHKCNEDAYYDNMEDVFDTLEGYDFY